MQHWPSMSMMTIEGEIRARVCGYDNDCNGRVQSNFTDFHFSVIDIHLSSVKRIRRCFPYKESKIRELHCVCVCVSFLQVAYVEDICSVLDKIFVEYFCCYNINFVVFLKRSVHNQKWRMKGASFGKMSDRAQVDVHPACVDGRIHYDPPIGLKLRCAISCTSVVRIQGCIVVVVVVVVL
jgi:hypothetical protein